MKRTLLSVAATSVLATLAAAQSPVLAELSTAEAVGVHANRQIDAVRAGTVAARPIALRATDGRVAHAASLAKVAPRLTSNAAVTGAAFEWRALVADGNRGGTLGANPLTAGPQHYRLVLRARSSTAGRLVLRFDGDVRGAASANAAVRVGPVGRRFMADGSAQRAAIPNLTVGPRALTIDVFVQGEAVGARGAGAGYSAALRVLFVPDGGPTCTVHPGQRSCPAGGVLRGSAQTAARNGVLSLGLSGALPNAIGLTLVSPTGRTFPVLGTSNCIFFATPIVHGTFTTDANGDALTRMPFPLRAGSSFFVQQGTLLASPRGFQVATSNTLEVRCN